MSDLNEPAIRQYEYLNFKAVLDKHHLYKEEVDKILEVFKENENLAWSLLKMKELN
jgi:hypothetical protein